MILTKNPIQNLEYKENLIQLLETKIKVLNKQIKKVNEDNRNQFGFVMYGKHNEQQLYLLLRLEGKKEALIQLKKELK